MEKRRQAHERQHSGSRRKISPLKGDQNSAQGFVRIWRRKHVLGTRAPNAFGVIYAQNCTGGTPVPLFQPLDQDGLPRQSRHRPESIRG
jgi:hypothetical protein